MNPLLLARLYLLVYVYNQYRLLLVVCTTTRVSRYESTVAVVSTFKYYIF